MVTVLERTNPEIPVTQHTREFGLLQPEQSFEQGVHQVGRGSSPKLRSFLRFTCVFVLTQKSLSHSFDFNPSQFGRENVHSPFVLFLQVKLDSPPTQLV